MPISEDSRKFCVYFVWCVLHVPRVAENFIWLARCRCRDRLFPSNIFSNCTRIINGTTHILCGFLKKNFPVGIFYSTRLIPPLINFHLFFQHIHTSFYSELGRTLIKCTFDKKSEKSIIMIDWFIKIMSLYCFQF